MLHIALCDDHPLFREGVKRILLRQPDFQVDEDVGTGAELLAGVAGRHIDVIILDITLPDMNGLDVVKALQTAGCQAAVLILSMHPEEQYALRALKAGASGYLQKESVPDDLVTAVRRVAEGSRYVTPTLAERLATELGGMDPRLPHERLSDREYEVLRLLALGKGVKEIAKDLMLKSPTVATYRARLMAKLGLTTIVDLVRYVLEHKLIE